MKISWKELCSYSDDLTAHFFSNRFTKLLGLAPTVRSKIHKGSNPEFRFRALQDLNLG